MCTENFQRQPGDKISFIGFFSNKGPYKKSKGIDNDDKNRSYKKILNLHPSSTISDNPWHPYLQRPSFWYFS
jgi:hypothetical protein